MSEMVERVARAMAGKRWTEFDEEHRNAALQLARTAIEAMREPTEAMLNVGQLGGDISEGQAEWCWQAMIDEAMR